MQGPTFQQFEKEKITNPFMNKGNNTLNSREKHHLNKEDSSTDILIFNRNKNTIESKVFLIIHNNFNSNRVKSITNYIKHILKLEKENCISIDTSGTFDKSLFENSETVYIIDRHDSNKGVVNEESTGNNISSLMLKEIFLENKMGALIFIAKNIEQVPKFICTISQLVFIQKDIENMYNTLALSAGIKFKDNSVIDLDMICIDKFSLWTKICNFNKN